MTQLRHGAERVGNDCCDEAHRLGHKEIQSSKDLANALRTLELDLGPHLFEGSLDLLGLIFRHALLDVLWRTLDEILRFLQPEAREGSDFPDDLDLLLANNLENDRELGLSFGCVISGKGSAAVALCPSSCHCTNGGRPPSCSTKYSRARMMSDSYSHCVFHRFQPKPLRFRARAIWRLIFFSTQSLTKPKHSLEFPTAK